MTKKVLGRKIIKKNYIINKINKGIRGRDKKYSSLIYYNK